VNRRCWRSAPAPTVPTATVAAPPSATITRTAAAVAAAGLASRTCVVDAFVTTNASCTATVCPPARAPEVDAPVGTPRGEHPAIWAERRAQNVVAVALKWGEGGGRGIAVPQAYRAIVRRGRYKRAGGALPPRAVSIVVSGGVLVVRRDGCVLLVVRV